MPRFLVWLLVLLLLAAFGAVVGLALRQRARAGRDMPAYSVYSDAADGLGEAAHLLKQLGWTPVAVTRPIQQTHDRGLLIVAGPPEEAISEAEAKATLRWVEAGNTLLLCSGHTTALHEALGVRVAADRSDADSFTQVEVGAAGGYTEDVERLSVDSLSTVRPPGAGLPLWWVGKSPGAVLIERGKGRVLVVADPNLLTRAGLVDRDGSPRDDNALFLVNVADLDARGGKVYFDEYHHGFQSGGGFWGYLAYHGQRWALVPILLAVGAAVWRSAVRLGPAVPTPQTSQADAVDYASALAHLYRRAGARRLLARTLVRGFLRDLTRHLRLRPTAVPAVILAAWRQQSPGASAERLQALLRGVGELRKGEVSDRQLLSWARAFGEFTAEMEKLAGGAWGGNSPPHLKAGRRTRQRRGWPCRAASGGLVAC